MSKYIIIILIIFICPFPTLGQDLFEVNKIYSSSKYSYSITIPKTFKEEEPKRRNINLKVADAYGASILVNITDRQPAEYNITAHDYTEAIFEDAIRQVSPNFDVTYSEKITIDGKNAFLIESIGDYPELKTMECHLFYNDKAFVVTANAPIKRFNRYRKLFKTAINSLTF